MKNAKTLIFSSLFLSIVLFSFSSFTNFQNLKIYQEEIKPISDSITYTILLGDLKSGTYDTSKIFEQNEIRVNRVVGGKNIENYVKVTKYSALLVPIEEGSQARMITCSTNKTEQLFNFLRSSKTGDKLIIAELEGYDAEGNRIKIDGSLNINLK